MSLQKQLDDMAKGLIEKATTTPEKGEAMGLKDQIDIFKATSAWYLGLRKRAKDDEDDSPDGSTFEALRTRINGNGAKQ
jgi:hypothetical protein